MSSAHLGALVTPFVDGELRLERAAEAAAHLRECPQCRQAVRAEQAARRRTQDSVRGVQASPELTARLLAMPTGSFEVSTPIDRHRRGPLVLGGGAALVGLFVLTLFVLGSPRTTQSPATLLGSTPAPTTAALEPAAMGAGTVELDDAAAPAWAVPASLTFLQLDVSGQQGSQTLDATLETGHGQVQLLEAPGTLDMDATVDAAPITIAGHVVYRVEDWYLLESGSCVVAVKGETDEAAEAVIADLPEPDGVLDRILAGWQILVG